MKQPMRQTAVNSLAAHGRNGDTRLAHLTPGEVVIPKEVAALRPDLVNSLAQQIKAMGGKPERTMVGRGHINPKTGIEEFATEAEVRAAYKATLGRDVEDAGALGYWMNQGDNFGSMFQQAAQSELSSRAPAPAPAQTISPAPAPSYSAAPSPTYYAPAPAPSYSAPAPTYYAPAPAPSYSAPAPAPSALPGSVNDLYRSVLGRDVEDAGALGYWQNRFGSEIDASEVDYFKSAAMPELAGVPQGPNNQYGSGYGGWQPEGSKYAGDNPMPLDYMQQLPAINDSTTNAVNYALQQAIDQAKRNGTDPNQSWTVQTLRGYTSGDAQAKANAIQQASSYAKQVNPSAYETHDYGQHAIVGFNQQVAEPTFSTAYDPNWNVPTLYDMINSTYGWTGREPNYADPANRDANLNRRLTAEEINAFQSGQLTPSLSSAVNQYRGGLPGTPGGTPVSGGGTGGGVSGGGLLGSVSSGSQSANQSSGTSGGFQPVTSRVVDAPTETIEGRIGNLLATDQTGAYSNPVVRQAADRATQAFAGRGLLNSSMAQQAAYEAATAKAIEIAGPDAQTYFNQGRANQDANNQFSRDSIQNNFTASENALNRQQQTSERLGTQSWQTTENAANRDLQWRTAVQSATNAMQQANLSATTQQEVSELNRQAQLMGNLSSTVNQMYQSFNSRIAEISVSDLDAETKNKLVADMTTYMKSGISLQGSINGDVNMKVIMDSLFPEVAA